MSFKNGEDLGKELAKARKVKNLTLDEVGNHTGFSNSYIYRIENGVRPNFSFRLLDMFLKLYEIDIERLKN